MCLPTDCRMFIRRNNWLRARSDSVTDARSIELQIIMTEISGDSLAKSTTERNGEFFSHGADNGSLRLTHDPLSALAYSLLKKRRQQMSQDVVNLWDDMQAYTKSNTRISCRSFA
jgi:hypothetical protein